MNAQERAVPHEIAVEKHVIGALIMDPDAEGADCLAPEDFWLARHAEIFRCIRGLLAERMGIDLFTLSDALKQEGKLEAAGGDAYLLEISAEVVSSANLHEHAQIVLDRSMKRRQIASATKILERAYGQEPAADTQRAFEAEAFSIGERSDTSELAPMSRILAESFRILELRQKGELSGLKTGLLAIDSMTGGLQNQDLIVLGARPAQGKTSLAAQIAAFASVDGGETVAFFEGEMSGRAVVDRLLFSRAGLDSAALRGGRVYERDFPKLAVAMKPLHLAPFFIDDSAGITPLQVLSKCRRLKKRRGSLSLVVIDNIQRMHSDRGEKDPRKVAAECSAMLKETAKDLNCPVIAVSHIRRLSGGPASEPTLSDLQESGNIEQDADIVLLLHNESAYREVTPDLQGKTKLIYAKFREGPIGYKWLAFDGKLTTFSDWSDRTETAPPMRRSPISVEEEWGTGEGPSFK